MNKNTIRYLTFGLILLTGAACAPAVGQIRASESASMLAHGIEAMTTEQWTMLLLRGTDHTCMGEPIVSPTAWPGRSPKLLAQREHVLFTDIGGPHVHAVWLQTHADTTYRYGIVALVRQEKKKLTIEALGSLALRPGHLQMAMGPLGASPALWVISEQHHFNKATQRTLYAKQLHILPQVKDHLVPSVSAPEIPLMRQEAMAMGGGWYRMVEYRAECDVQGLRLSILEHLQSKELLVRKPHVPARQSSQSQSRRTLFFTAPDGWQSSAPALWIPVKAGRKK